MSLQPSLAFAVAGPAPPARQSMPDQAPPVQTAPGTTSRTSWPVACTGLLIPALAAGRRGKKGPASKIAMKDATDATYALQKEAHVDLEFLNDVGYLPDGTAINRAGNAINHPERMQADKHIAGAPLPRAKFVNSVGYLPDGTPLNAAGNAINHPERMMPDSHAPGSPLPPASYMADIGYLADGTALTAAGNNSVKHVPATASNPTPAPTFAPAASPVAQNTVTHGRGFEYSAQRDAYADQEFTNDVGYLPDGTPMNRAGNAINHPDRMAPDSHTPGSPLPRANFVNSVGYLPDGTPLNAAGNAINHPERMMPDPHAPGSPLPASSYLADTGYFADGTALTTAGNNSVTQAVPAPASNTTPAPTSAPAPAASPVGQNTVTHGRGFEYSVQRDAHADQEFTNDVGYLPDGTPMNRAGNAINHPDRMAPDTHTPGSPLPRANFVNSVGYLPDGTPLNQAGNAINHPEYGALAPDIHTPGAPLPISFFAADVGYLVDGTPLDAAGNNSVKMEPTPAPTPPPPVAAAPAPTPPAPVAAAPAPTPPPPVAAAPAPTPRPPAPTVSPAPVPVSNRGVEVDCLADGTPIHRAGNNSHRLPEAPQVSSSGFARRRLADEPPVVPSCYLPW